MEIIKNDIPELLSIEAIRTVYDIQLIGGAPQGDVHDFPEIIYVYKGENTILVDGKRVVLTEGKMTVYPPGAYHIGEFPSTASVYVITFDTSSPALSVLYSRAIELSAAQRETFTAIMPSALKLFERVPKSNELRGMKKKEGVSEYELQKLKKSLELFLIGLISTDTDGKMSPQKELFYRITDYLVSDLCRSVSLDEVATKFHIGKSTLTALFRSEYGEGMITYFNRMRIEKAKELIRRGEMNFTEISYAVGFSSIHYFSRLFKSVEGITPSEYLKKYRVK